MAVTIVFHATTDADARILSERLLDRGISIDVVPAAGRPGYAFEVTAHDRDGRLTDEVIAKVTEYISVRVEENHGAQPQGTDR